jgi:hypothetical protein
MAIRVALNHATHYRYDRPVALSPHTLRLRPAPHCRTPIQAYSLKAEPAQDLAPCLEIKEDGPRLRHRLTRSA